MGPLDSSSLIISSLALWCLLGGGTEMSIFWSLSLSRLLPCWASPRPDCKSLPKPSETNKEGLGKKLHAGAGDWIQAQLSMPACSPALISFFRERVKPSARPTLCPELPLPTSTLAPPQEHMLSDWFIGKIFHGNLSDTLNSNLLPLSTDNLIKAILTATKEYRLTPALDR